ncbi:MAG TPA: SDR family NAD(P)-dependent oxidoreductase [Planctomycetota bacterium]|jgi:hypothetical protein
MIDKITRPLVFITGASSGIGAAAVSVFAAAGYNVILTARRKEKLDEIARRASETYRDAQIIPLTCDVSSDDSVKAAFDQVAAKFDRLDVLINNAGYGVYGSVEKTPIDFFRANMETNYLGAIRCTQAALPLLRKAAAASRRRWGASIVMVSSIVGRRTIPNMSSYCATKFALEALSETLRVELRDERIAVSVVNPGVTQTEFGHAAAGTRPDNFLQGGMSAEAVARVLLKAARRPRRNVYLTPAGKLGVFLQWISPRLVDQFFLRFVWRKTQNK